MPEPITVRKLNLAGEETWRYTGYVLQREDTKVVLEARFNRPDTPFFEIELKQNDRFVETFYSDRWYNIFEIHDRDDDHLKGWYCNLSRPARFEQGAVSFVDLALDLLVYPDGRQLVLDEDEFALLELDAAEQSQVKTALSELQERFHHLLDVVRDTTPHNTQGISEPGSKLSS